MFDPQLLVDEINARIGDVRIGRKLEMTMHWLRVELKITRKGGLMVSLTTRYSHKDLNLGFILVEVSSCNGGGFLGNHRLIKSDKNFGEWYATVSLDDCDDPSNTMVNFVCAEC